MLYLIVIYVEGFIIETFETHQMDFNVEKKFSLDIFNQNKRSIFIWSTINCLSKIYIHINYSFNSLF